MTDREIMQQALDAFEAIMFEKDTESCQIIAKNARYSLREALAQPEQSKYSDIVSDGGLDPRNKFDAQPEQEPFKPDWVSYRQGVADGAAQPEQEPVAWMMPDYGDVLSASEADGTGIYNVPLYTAPQKYCPSENNAAYEKGFVEGMAKQMHSNVDRAVNAMAKPWVGLTEDELKEIQYSTDTQVEYVTYDEGEYGTEIDIFPENFAYAIEAKLKEKNNAV